MRNLPLPSPHSLRDFGFFFWRRARLARAVERLVERQLGDRAAWVTLNMPSEKRAVCGGAPGAESEVSSTTPLRASIVEPIGIACRRPAACSPRRASRTPGPCRRRARRRRPRGTRASASASGSRSAWAWPWRPASGSASGSALRRRATTIRRVARRRAGCRRRRSLAPRRRARRRRRLRGSPPSSGRPRSEHLTVAHGHGAAGLGGPAQRHRSALDARAVVWEPIAGAAGATVSIVKLRVAGVSSRMPAASTARTDSVYAPSAGERVRRRAGREGRGAEAALEGRARFRGGEGERRRGVVGHAARPGADRRVDRRAGGDRESAARGRRVRVARGVDGAHVERVRAVGQRRGRVR